MKPSSRSGWMPAGAMALAAAAWSAAWMLGRCPESLFAHEDDGAP